MFRLMIGLTLLSSLAAWAAPDPVLTATLDQNADAAAEAMAFCQKYAQGWLAYADPETGLLPRNLADDLYWNAKDAAADNYPFLTLTAQVTGLYYLKQAAVHILEQEQVLATRPGGLPDTWDFRTREFQTGEPVLADLVFGAAEYVKDGLMPIVEWTGPGPWLDRMQALVRAIYEQTENILPAKTSPSGNIEVCGDLMQSMSRLYWQTGDAWYKERCYLLADRYLFEQPVSALERIRLRDHGCEVIGGLSEVFVIAAREDAERCERYRPALYALLDLILEKGINEDGMMPDWVNTKTGEQDWERTSDGWGYVYDAFLTVALVDNHEPYRQAAVHALDNIHKYLGTDWERGSADGYADSIEGALNLLNRLPVANAFEWVDQSMGHIFDKQGEDGIIEGWHGDGNAARTALMYALWKTQGVTVHPWREDVRLGAALDAEGALRIQVEAQRPWNGTLHVDRPRHREYLRLPLDYPRINQFPEWFTAPEEAVFTMQIDDAVPGSASGKQLWNLPFSIEPGRKRHIIITPANPAAPPAGCGTPAFRASRYTPGDAGAAMAWQQELRVKLADLLRVSLPAETGGYPPPIAKTLNTAAAEAYERQDIVLEVSESREIPAILTRPLGSKGGGPFPAVVCIHGHGATRETVYDSGTPYHGFAEILARSGVVTLAVEVGQHQVQDPTTTLLGERLTDLFRCVDYLVSLPEVDTARIGCAGLSLGGEMAMWLGALDTRIGATVSSGFLTFMNQMERNHCICWKEEGLRECADFPDIYALIAPRALLCQVGRQEPLSQFNPVLAKRAFDQLSATFEDLDAGHQVVLDLHDGAHEVCIPTMKAFLLGHTAATQK